MGTEQPNSPKRLATTAGGPRPTVLIADDNAIWRGLIAQVLAAEYNIVGFVERGDEVLSRAIELQPEVITLDVSMPGISGLNVLPKLRVAMPKAAIVIVAATATKLYIDEAYTRGANGYIDKRKTLSDLIPAILNCAGRSCREPERQGIE